MWLHNSIGPRAWKQSFSPLWAPTQSEIQVQTVNVSELWQNASLAEFRVCLMTSGSTPKCTQRCMLTHVCHLQNSKLCMQKIYIFNSFQSQANLFLSTNYGVIYSLKLYICKKLRKKEHGYSKNCCFSWEIHIYLYIELWKIFTLTMSFTFIYLFILLLIINRNEDCSLVKKKIIWILFCDLFNTPGFIRFMISTARVTEPATKLTWTSLVIDYYKYLSTLNNCTFNLKGY